MISYFNGVAQLRQHIKKSQRVHGVILDGGKAANIIPDFTHARFYNPFESLHLSQFDQLFQLRRLNLF